MAYEKRPNTGTLGRNKEKDSENPDHQKWPDYSGQINVDGNDYWLSAWLKQNSETGEKFFSLSVKPKERKEKPKPAGFDDDIPFSPHEKGWVV